MAILGNEIRIQFPTEAINVFDNMHTPFCTQKCHMVQGDWPTNKVDVMYIGCREIKLSLEDEMQVFVECTCQKVQTSWNISTVTFV